MDFGKIVKDTEGIDLDLWSEVISKHELLEQAPDRKGVNPFTHEEVIFSGVGVAFYCEGGENVGNICFQEGALLTTGVPMSVCSELAKIFNAVASEDDRS
ncbi:hypothetical protein P3339_18920 [Microbulbifer sp. MLAF003]|uniref:hypothetical protein n=1 Tax=unclassified Microbulbifer TaxID=2619833 RepID=UPI0024ACF8AF|nr:hypothetical protein [Microbulbifer sp. MLAF003]WHI50490.1 hypothetical protein P3339_18920 [Microbulbifer sp. MLAF003]